MGNDEEHLGVMHVGVKWWATDGDAGVDEDISGGFEVDLYILDGLLLFSSLLKRRQWLAIITDISYGYQRGRFKLIWFYYCNQYY